MLYRFDIITAAAIKVLGAAAYAVAISGEFARHAFKADVVDPHWFRCASGSVSSSVRIRIIQGAKPMRIWIQIRILFGVYRHKK
jgi:hypothetical protein